MLKSRLWHKTHTIALPLQASALYVTVVGVKTNIPLGTSKCETLQMPIHFIFSLYQNTSKGKYSIQKCYRKIPFKPCNEDSLNRELFNTYRLQSRLYLQWFLSLTASLYVTLITHTVCNSTWQMLRQLQICFFLIWRTCVNRIQSL